MFARLFPRPAKRHTQWTSSDFEGMDAWELVRLIAGAEKALVARLVRKCVHHVREFLGLHRRDAGTTHGCGSVQR